MSPPARVSSPIYIPESAYTQSLSPGSPTMSDRPTMSGYESPEVIIILDDEQTPVEEQSSPEMIIVSDDEDSEQTFLPIEDQSLPEMIIVLDVYIDVYNWLGDE